VAGDDRPRIAAGEAPELARAQAPPHIDIDSGHWQMISKPIELAGLLAAATADCRWLNGCARRTREPGKDPS
jgi:hypothetical protein